MGNPKFAIKPLKSLLESNHEIVAIISNPPKKMGRKKIFKHTDVGEYALDNNLKLIELDDFNNNETYHKIASLNVDLFVVVAFKILPQKYIELPKFGSVNIHASMLPKYRGAAPIQWSLMNGDVTTGISIFQIERKVDTGKIIYQEKISIDKDDNFESLSVKLSKLASETIIKSLRLLENNDHELKLQDDLKSTKAPKIMKSMLKIDWSWKGNKINNWIRGLSPYPGMYTVNNGKKYKIFKACVMKHSSELSPGKIEIINLKKLVVHSSDSLISILELQQEGKKRLLIKDFLKGSNFKHGDYFF